MLLEQENFRAETGEHAFCALHQFAGTDAERAADMQKALDDPSVRAIWFTRGGYGSVRTLMLLDWTGFQRNPKWLVGFSDITVFHACLNSLGVASVHGLMTAYFLDNGRPTESLHMTLSLLRGNDLAIRVEPNPLNRTGTCKGELAGGNLTLLMSLRGTSLDQTFEGKILFIEDIQEFDYHIDRMMMNLRFGGVLSRLAGLIVGYFTDTKTNETPFGLTACEIIRQAVEGYPYPVVFGFPAGHEIPNCPLLMGGTAELEVTEGEAVLRQSIPGLP